MATSPSCVVEGDPTGPASPPITTRELSRLVPKIYVDGGFFTRLIRRWRPHICPFDRLLSLIPEGSRVLDVGCGGGLFLGLLSCAGRIHRGVGFDIKRSALDSATRMADRVKEMGTEAELTFELRSATEEWSDGQFDVVSMVDVMHHLPPARQQSVFKSAADRVSPGGRFLYKDMVRKPAWRAWANRLHDAIMAREWIHYVPIEHIESWAGASGLRLVHAQTINCWCYGHELRLFERPSVE